MSRAGMVTAGGATTMALVPRFGRDDYVLRAAIAVKTSFGNHLPPKFIPPKIWHAYFRPFSGNVAEMKSHMCAASYDLSVPPYTWDTDNPEAARGPGMKFYYPWDGDRVFVHVDSRQGYPFLARGVVISLRDMQGREGCSLANRVYNGTDIPDEEFIFTLRLQHPRMLMRGVHRLFFYKGPQLELRGNQWTVWRKGMRWTMGPASIFPI